MSNSPHPEGNPLRGALIEGFPNSFLRENGIQNPRKLRKDYGTYALSKLEPIDTEYRNTLERLAREHLSQQDMDSKEVTYQALAFSSHALTLNWETNRLTMSHLTPLEDRNLTDVMSLLKG